MMKTRLGKYAAAGAFVLTMAATSTAGAAVLSASVGGVPDAAGMIYENFNGLSLGNAGGVTGTGIMVNFSGTAQTVQGSASGLYASPFLSAGNGALFGDVDGPTASPYLSTGNSSIELLLPGQQLYFGLLWGSVDDYNSLAFYDGYTLVGTFTGLDVDAAAHGDQGANGTFYVNIDFDTAFNRVVASSSQYAFEFDNVALSSEPQGPGGNQVSEPASLAMIGLGLLGMGAVARRRRS